MKKSSIAICAAALIGFLLFRDNKLTDEQHKQWSTLEKNKFICTLFERHGFNLRGYIRRGKKLTLNQVDIVLARSGVSLDPTSRMHIKNLLLEARLMPFGVVGRTARDVAAAKDFVSEIDRLN